jgi:hypothetical protein
MRQIEEGDWKGAFEDTDGNIFVAGLGCFAPEPNCLHGAVVK